MIWKMEGGGQAPAVAVEAALQAQTRYGVPAGILLATAECESDFRLGLVSGAGAVGPMQFLRRYEKDYARYAGFAFDPHGWEAILGAGAVFRTYAGWAGQRHGLSGEDVWRFAVSAHRYGHGSAACLNMGNRRVQDVERHMRRNGLWYDFTLSHEERTAQAAAVWALGKVGCRYSQSERTKEDVFDCSSLAARAYAAQGVAWGCGNTDVPVSYRMVYEDQFRLLWPADYSGIGRKFGGDRELELACRPGDLQFLCTDRSSSRSNRITHVAMVVNAESIVHARSVRYGVCLNDRDLYKGRVCALVRYDPQTPLREGMRGDRVRELQKALRAAGERGLAADGVFGKKTLEAFSRHPEVGTC